MTFYGVFCEYYRDGSRKSGIITREAKKKPKAKIRKPYGLTAFEFWSSNEQAAIDLKNSADQYVSTVGDMFHFYRGYVAGGAE